eukprot:gi/632985424/ref/XP_007909674.1/ PREDICTED: GTPase-activating Rap/Ran-GAP domain-like protein 3 [Callorhinchus milii]
MSEPTAPKLDSAPKAKKWNWKPVEEETRPGALSSANVERFLPEASEAECEAQRHLSSSSDPESGGQREESSPLSAPFKLNTSFDEDVIDLK